MHNPRTGVYVGAAPPVFHISHIALRCSGVGLDCPGNLAFDSCEVKYTDHGKLGLVGHGLHNDGVVLPF
jgi:hypothetical protein